MPLELLVPEDEPLELELDVELLDESLLLLSLLLLLLPEEREGVRRPGFRVVSMVGLSAPRLPLGLCGLASLLRQYLSYSDKNDNDMEKW